MIPTRLIPQLGLRPTRVRQGRSASGVLPRRMYEAARLTIQGRECSVEVYEISDSYPLVIGLIPLGVLDWVVDHVEGKVIGTPEHGGEHVIEAISAWSPGGAPRRGAFAPTPRSDAPPPPAS